MREEPKTKAHLLELIRNSYADYERLLMAIPTERLSDPMMGDWTVRDVVAHVTWGEREMIPVVREMRLHGSELWNLPQDERNKRMVEESRHKTATEIMNEHRDAHRDLIAALEALDDADLTDDTRLKDAPPGWTVWELVAGNTFRHYPEHVENLEEFLERGHIRLEHDAKTKAGVIERMDRERAKLDALLNGLTDEQLTQRGSDGSWAIKDHLAHLAVWEAGVAALLRKQPRWEAMGLTQEFIKSHSEEELNAKIEAAHQGMSLAEVKDLFERSHRDLLAALDSLNDEDLARPVSYYDPDSTNPRQVLDVIHGNTTGHWFEHRGWVKESLMLQTPGMGDVNE